MPAAHASERHSWTVANRRERVEIVPYRLGSGAHLLRGHARVRHEHLGSLIGWNEPVARDGNAVDCWRLIAQALFPTFEIHGAAERGQHHKLSEGYAGAPGHLLRGCECIGAVRRQPED